MYGLRAGAQMHRHHDYDDHNDHNDNDDNVYITTPHDLHDIDGDGDLGIAPSQPGGSSNGLPAPHRIPGSAYPAPPRAAFAEEPSHRPPPSVGASSAGGRSRSSQRHSYQHPYAQQQQQQRVVSAPLGAPGVGTYRASAGPGPASETSSRRTRHSLPPPNSYPYASPVGAHSPALDEYGQGYGAGYAAAPYSNGGGGGRGMHMDAGGEGYDAYAMPTYLYAPSPRSGGAPSVSSGASGSAAHSHTAHRAESGHGYGGRNDGIFAVAAPHHSLGQQARRQQQLHAMQGYGPQGPASGSGSGSGVGSGSGSGGGAGMAVGDVLPPFPPWSMAWYAGHMSADGHAYTMVPPQGSGAGDWESDTLTSSGYAAGYPHHFRPYGHGSPYPYGHVGGGTTPGAELDPEARAAARKAARLRALEREFGLKVDGRTPGQGHDGDADADEDDDDAFLLEKGGRRGGLDDLDDEEDEVLPPGSITSDGHYVHRHPKMRRAVSIALLLLALLAFAIGAGGSYIIKLPPNSPPNTAPAKGTAGSYVLYVLSFLCMGMCFHLFVIRPCCVEPVRRRRINNAALANGPGLAGAGGLVVPVLSPGVGKSGGGFFGGGGKAPKMGARGMPGGGRGKRGLFGGRSGGQGMPPPPTVNLIVDPRAMLGGPLDDDDDDDSTDDEADGLGRDEKNALAGPENADLAGLIGGRLGAAAGSPDLHGGAGGGGGRGNGGLTKKQRRKKRRAARLRALNRATRRAAFQPFLLASLRTHALWLSAQSALWLLAVAAALVPLFRSTSSVSLAFVDARTGEVSQRQVNVSRTALGAACPPRGGDGWCDAYNGARASAVIALVVCVGLAAAAVQELREAKKMARREGAGFRVR